ncbi:hypothetical protein CPT_Privateer_108 [Proteus phage Privateer]|uniref:Uncharacterized protein n=1 Tax=Proteus phage Privateer TaxID=2712958 RepID=A0A6G8R405_9CAUD|nr:hypothetical protein HWD17_gp108 [Proteus phage Privateer]QIN94901.1 hypothetical protein CPT_Privateer_108 [Proteus phage Privateer]
MRQLYLGRMSIKHPIVRYPRWGGWLESIILHKLNKVISYEKITVVINNGTLWM